MAGAGPDQDTAEDLHAGRQVSDMHKDRGGLDDDTPGTRLARLRQAVGDDLQARRRSRAIWVLIDNNLLELQSMLEDDDTLAGRVSRAMMQ